MERLYYLYARIVSWWRTGVPNTCENAIPIYFQCQLGHWWKKLLLFTPRMCIKPIVRSSELRQVLVIHFIMSHWPCKSFEFHTSFRCLNKSNWKKIGCHFLLGREKIEGLQKNKIGQSNYVALIRERWE